ncbi:hypothetical protein [Rhizobium sp. SG570]|uniref:hypothetical protein n=1 Tax=Rhizobium sp. SG570 TaxID=2587113 RepID=UPI00144574DF|nr:hypothetical protein [Rhizobium sp. SG570]NKJ34934.1 hypothetical protein [Rhizobium sp. SG570]
MKPQQRTFVVEFKSARRRSSMRQDSIWSGTDLKTLAREAEAEAPHLFDPNTVATTPSQDGVMPAESEPAVHLDNKIETVDDKQISASLTEAEQSSPSQQDNAPTFSAVPDVKEVRAGRASPRVSRRRRQASVVHHAQNAKGAVTERLTTAQGEMPSDELVVLDEENRRLKGLLANHLRQQNKQLREMLARLVGI